MHYTDSINVRRVWKRSSQVRARYSSIRIVKPVCEHAIVFMYKFEIYELTRVRTRCTLRRACPSMILNDAAIKAHRIELVLFTRQCANLIGIYSIVLEANGSATCLNR